MRYPIFRLFTFLLFASYLFPSCDNVTEEIYINEDGTGKYTIYTDMIPSMRTMMTQMSAFMPEDSTNQGKTAAEKEAEFEDKLWKEFPESVDSIMDKNEMIPDTLDEATKAFMEKTEMFMKGGRKEGYMHMGMRVDFSSIKELNEFWILMQEQQKANAASSGMPGSGLNNVSADTEYEIGKRLFKRKCDYSSFKEVDGSELAMMKMMMQRGTYRTIVHLPKRAKKVKGEHLVSKDGKTVTFEYNLIDLMEGKVNTDFEIKMKRK